MSETTHCTHARRFADGSGPGAAAANADAGPGFGWLVESGNAVHQVDADRAHVAPGGTLTFWRDLADASVLVTAYPGGTWASVQIMSQVTGCPTGRRTVATRKTKTAPWQQVQC